jgi:multicomponent Na+:H+ antiporter subunit A
MSSLILETATRATFQTILVFSLFLLFAGHNAPGGGFIGGLLAAAAFGLRYISKGFDDLHKLIPMAPSAILGAGLLLAGATGAAALLAGGAFLQSGFLEIDLPVLGHLAVSSVLAFDTGVYLVVVGLTLGVLDTLGGEMEA